MSVGEPAAELLERGSARPRLVTISATDRLGLYRVLRVADPDGPPPAAGQFAMLAPAAGRHGDSQPRARAFSIARWRDGETYYLIQGSGRASGRLCRVRVGEKLWVLGPLGRGFILPGHGCRAILVGGGVGIAPLVILHDALASAGHTAANLSDGTIALLGFRDDTRALAATLLPGSRAVASDGPRGRSARVTDLLARELDRDDEAIVYACGPPGLLEAVRTMCAARGVRGQLALSAPVKCGFGACDSCLIPRRDGGHLRVCVDGPVVEADQVGCLASADGSP